MFELMFPPVLVLVVLLWWRSTPHRFEVLNPPVERRAQALGPIVVGLFLAAAIVSRSPVVAVAGFSIALFVRRLNRQRLARIAARRLNLDLVSMADEMVLSLRSGGSLSSSFLEAAASTGECAAHYAPVLGAVEAGMSLGQALDQFGVDEGPKPLDLFATSLAVLVHSGGPAVVALERLGEGLRATLAADGERHTQSSQAMASAVVLAVLPVVFAGSVAWVEPAARQFYLRTPFGGVCLMAMLGLTGTSWLWMQSIAGGE
ncbi:MAG: tight adherence protein B [Acidimicrobiales bacterium]